MADETSQDREALERARERFTRARQSIGDVDGALKEIVDEYQRDERLSSVEAFNEFRQKSRRLIEPVEDTLSKVLNGSLSRD